ncbi:hypothetical protein [Streptomyces sp. NPDC097640]|uniref:hypothetical protein n=1 Tax=Streptomyces sp. NPDC097640 TaxID=3157229 RepID=UPI003325F65D
MTSEQDAIFAMAAESNSFAPIAMFQLKWATVIEIQRSPGVARRLRAAEDAAQSLDKDHPKWRAVMGEICKIMQAARAEAISGRP